MADPIKAEEESERLVAYLTVQFVRNTPFRFNQSIRARTPRQPTLHERYRSEARGESFGEWLKAQGLA